MPYRDITLVSIYGLHGTLHVHRAENAEGVSVQAVGPYEAKVVDGTWLKIYPESQELEVRRASRTDITAGGALVGSVDVSFRMRLLTDSGPHPRSRASAGAQTAIWITAPPGTKVELTDCHGLLRYSRGRRIMPGSGRFDIR
jgi:hypothetical protein